MNQMLHLRHGSKSALSIAGRRIAGNYWSGRSSGALALASVSLLESRYLHENSRKMWEPVELVAAVIPERERRGGSAMEGIRFRQEPFAFVDGALMDWLRLWRQVKIPKGFENFFPKKSQKAGGSEEVEAKTDANNNNNNNNNNNDNNNKNNNNNGGGGSGGGGKGNGSNEETPIWVVVGAMLFLGFAVSLFGEGQKHGQEVTWSEFRNYMLEPGDVERITVINKKTACVHLRPGAKGLPRLPHSTPQNSSSSSSPTSTQSPDPANWDDATLMDMGTQSRKSPTQTFETLSPFPGSSTAQDQHLIYHFHIGSVESFEDKLTRVQQELKIPSRDYVPVQYAVETDWRIELIKVFPIIFTIALAAFFLSGVGGMGTGGGSAGRGGMGGIFQIGKSNAKKINKEDVNVSFKDVAGCLEAKKEIMEFVDFLQDAERFTKLGAKIPKGALLCGPPGTGKTLLAKAVAGEANVPFFSISGSDFIEMFVGVGPSRVRDLFKEARSSAPCIIFIDEIDAVGRKRGRGGFSGGNDERENTLNQLLVEMDGFNPSAGVVVLAGTNRVDILDDALTRPGRFDRQIQVDKPDLQGRKEIFQVHLKGITLDGQIDDFSGRLAGLTPGFAGADIANICNEAAIVAARRKAESVSIQDFEKATDRIIGGLESNKIMSKEERDIVAHHEAGHAVAGWFLEHADPLLKVTIIPRSSGALGYAQYLPKEIFLRTQDQIMDIVCMALAGRAAEEIFFGRVTTGASDDLRKVTDIIYSTIQVYGMNSRVGQLAFPKDPNDMPGDKPYSDATAEAMDEEARSIVEAAYQRTLDLLKEKKEAVEKVASLLLEKETITHDDIVELVGPRPFKGDPAYEEFVTRRNIDNNNKSQEESKNAEDENDDSEMESGSDGLTPGLI